MKTIKIALFIGVAVLVAFLIGQTPNRSGVKNQAYVDDFDQLQVTINHVAHDHGDGIGDYLCPEDEIWNLYNTYQTRFNTYGKMFYLWQCYGDSDHRYWIKA